jgi:hypothetical protein
MHIYAILNERDIVVNSRKIKIGQSPISAQQTVQIFKRDYNDTLLFIIAVPQTITTLIFN